MKKVNCDQSINGILLVNKPQGLSSNALLQQVKRLYKAKKAGHTGSLDPLATGMLPICLGEATKFCQYLLDADKCYEATGLLGVKTNTGDSLGNIVAKSMDFNLTEFELLDVIAQYRGAIQQVPSMFSALKHKGMPLYKYAREGIEIKRDARNLMIYKLELTRFNEKEFDIEVLCSKGTYIRSLIEDIGDDLGVGAHVTKLHRRFTAGFINETMYSMEELQAKTFTQLLDCLLPMERAVNGLPIVVLNQEEILTLRQGKTLTNNTWNHIVFTKQNANSCVRLHDQMSHFIGLGQMQNEGVLMVKRLLTEQATIDTI